MADAHGPGPHALPDDDASTTAGTPADTVQQLRDREQALREREALLDVQEFMLDVGEALMDEREVLLDVREIQLAARERLIERNQQADQRPPRCGARHGRHPKTRRPAGIAVRCPRRRR